MYEKFGSYSLWGSPGHFSWVFSEDDVGRNKQAYDTHNECFLLIIPEVILHGNKDEIKLHQ